MNGHAHEQAHEHEHGEGCGCGGPGPADLEALLNLTQKDVNDIVLEDLRSAVDNGYSFKGWTAEAIATDIMTYSAACEGMNPEMVVIAVQQWMATQAPAPAPAAATPATAGAA